MSSVCLKMIALIAMLADHIAAVLGWEGWNLLPFNVNSMRCIGRISYPIFAFCLVAGWKHTRNRKRYFLRLISLAGISQIPFSLALYISNITTGYSKTSLFRVIPIALSISIFVVLSYWYLVEKKKFSVSLIQVSFTALLPVIMLKLNGMWIITPDHLNVLYTLSIGLMLLFVFEQLKKQQIYSIRSLWLILLASLCLLFYGTNADYGNNLMGVILIISLYFTQKSRILQGTVIGIWGVLFYGILLNNWNNAFATFIPIFLILIHNDERGNNSFLAKWGFYIFYPLHLLILGLFNIHLHQ